MPRHQDFEKIYQAFIKHYGEKEGATLYQIWISKLGLDDTKPYEQLKEKFSWSPSYIKYLKEDETAKYFECEALFPLTSMNNNLYTITELQQRAASIIDKTVNWNHTNELAKDVSIPDAEFYNGCVRCLLKVMKGSNDLKRIESGESVNQSVEVDCRRGITETPNGNQCNGLVFTGLALLTKDVLPGVPLTRIMPVEKLVESFAVTSVTSLEEKTEEGPSEMKNPKPPEDCSSGKTSQTGGNVDFHAKIADLETKYETLKNELQGLKKPTQEPKKEPCKCVLTKEGFWQRFHQLRSEGLSKSDAFRLVSLEVLEAASEK